MDPMHLQTAGRPRLKNTGTCFLGLIAGSLLSVFIPSQILHAEVYKWTDADGSVHYGDKPGKDAVNLESVELRQSTPVKDPIMEERLNNRNKVLKVLEEEREEREEDKAHMDEEKEVRMKNCNLARKSKKRLDAVGPIYKLDGRGNKVFLDEEENKAERRRVEELVRKWCG